MMSREKQIEQAVRILGGRSREDVIDALNELGLSEGHRYWSRRRASREGQAALRRVADAIHRAENALRDPRMPHPAGFLKQTIDDLAATRAFFEASANDRRKLTRSAADRQMAVAYSYSLLRKHLPKSKPSTTKSGAWARLAAILHGESKADVQRWLRAHAKRRKPKK
jgi:hypothetical protein